MNLQLKYFRDSHTQSLSFNPSYDVGGQWTQFILSKWYGISGCIAFDGILILSISGLQISPDWQEYFEHPTGKTLGEGFAIYPNLDRLNDLQVSSILLSFLATFSLFFSLLLSLISLADERLYFLGVVSCALGLPSRLLPGMQWCSLGPVFAVSRIKIHVCSLL